MSYGLKIFNWVEDAEKEFGGVRSFYEAKEVDDYIRSLKAENKRLLKNRCFEKFLHCDVMTLRTNVKISVPIFRVDYDYIKISDAEDFLR